MASYCTECGKPISDIDFPLCDECNEILLNKKYDEEEEQ